MRFLFVLFVVGARLACASVENPVCSKIGEHKYRISFETSGKGEQVTIYASSRADRIDSTKAVAKVSASPVEVTVDRPGRVYFHLRPAKGPVRVVADRRIDLEGTYNTRDIGGYRTTDGHYVKWGLIYRSDQLHDLTEHDIEYFKGLGLKLVCDFRVDNERAESPTDTQRFPSTTFANMNIDSYGGRYGQLRGGRGGSGPVAPPAAAPVAPAAPPAPAAYFWLPIAAPQYAAVFRRIAAGDLPVLFHCFAGKDRTGMMAGLILTALGVPRETVMEDYLLTNNVTDEKLAVAALPLRRRGDNVADPAALRRSAGVTRGQMEATFQSIDKNFGSVDGYLQKELGLTAADLKTIRGRLLD